jgi:hypothetical protein
MVKQPPKIYHKLKEIWELWVFITENYTGFLVILLSLLYCFFYRKLQQCVNNNHGNDEAISVTDSSVSSHGCNDAISVRYGVGDGNGKHMSKGPSHSDSDAAAEEFIHGDIDAMPEGSSHSDDSAMAQGSDCDDGEDIVSREPSHGDIESIPDGSSHSDRQCCVFRI